MGKLERGLNLYNKVYCFKIWVVFCFYQSKGFNDKIKEDLLNRNFVRTEQIAENSQLFWGKEFFCLSDVMFVVTTWNT